ncbi:hypothetical protein PV327_011518, partial [Microctonus hyperodae]
MTLIGKLTCGTFIKKWKYINIDKLSKYYYHTLKYNCKKNISSINYSTRINNSKIIKPTGNKNVGKLIKNNENNKSEIYRLFLLAKPEKWKLTGAIILLIVSSTVTMAVPFCLGKIIDIIYVTDDKNTTRKNLNKLCIGLLIIAIVGGLCNFGRIYYMSTSGHRITQNLRKKAYTAILNQETAMFDKISTGELVGRLTG